MSEKNYKAVIDDSSRNRFLFYYSGSSICCKELSKDGLAKETVIASQVSESFLTAIDLQDNIYVACANNDKGLYLFSHINNEWKLDQILNIQGNGNLYILSLFVHNGSTHIIYAKQMTIANFYNIYHLYKPSSPNAYHLNTTWRKNNVGEIYAEDIENAYSAIITREGVLHLVNEWYDGSNYLINYSWYDAGSDSWKKRSVTSLFKKDIKVNILYEENMLHLLCYTFEDDVSAIFYYTRKEGSNRDFEFSFMDKIKTNEAIIPFFYIEGSTLYLSWLSNDKFGQYAMNKEQRNWSKKLINSISDDEAPKVVEYIRNRKGKALITKKTYFYIDNKGNITFPYFKENSTSSHSSNSKSDEASDHDFNKYIPYVLDELKNLSEIVKALSLRMDKFEGRKLSDSQHKTYPEAPKQPQEQRPKSSDSSNSKLKRSNFRDQFMNTNKLLNKPEASALYVGASNIPDPDELSKKEGIDFAQNDAPVIEKKPIEKKPVEKQAFSPPPEIHQNKQETDNTQKDTNLFKKIGDFFK